jgi:hypothetical protein
MLDSLTAVEARNGSGRTRTVQRDHPSDSQPAERHLGCTRSRTLTKPLIAGTVIFALLLFAPQVLNDGDTLWQITTGKWILQHLSIPSGDPFSYTMMGSPWVPHEWLAEVVLALTFQVAKWQGVMTLTAGCVGLSFMLLARQLYRFLSPLAATTGLFLTAGLAAPSMLARPHVLALPIMVAWCGSITLARAEKRSPTLMLLPLMTLWVNLHGSFIVGLALLFPLAFEALLDNTLERRRTLRAWSGFIAAAIAAALITPEPMNIITFPFQLVSMHQLAAIGEWQPVSFANLQPLEIVLLGSLGLGLWGKASVPPLRLILLLFLFHSSLQHGRHGYLLGFLGALLLAEPLSRNFPAAPLPAPSGRLIRSLAPILCAIALVSLVGIRLARPAGRNIAGADPAAAMANVPGALRNQPVLNDYAFGGYLIFHGIRPFIDGRADLYGDAFLARYAAIIHPDPVVLEHTLRDYHVSWTIFSPNNPVVGLLDREPGWHRIYADSTAVVHVGSDLSFAPGGDGETGTVHSAP